MRSKLLDVTGLTMDFGGLRALDNVDIDVRMGEIVALIGPNGAGKTTLFNCLTGLVRPTKGDIRLIDTDGKQHKLNNLKPNQVTARGMARTFQNIRLFGDMSAIENVMVGRHCRTQAGILGAIFRGPATRNEEREITEMSYELLQKVGIERYANELARNLPYGAQRKLEIARALATEPFLLLLDEPAAGLNPQETDELDALITRIRNEDQVAILLIEHDMKLVMNISDRIFVLDYGKKIAEGSPRRIKDDPIVIKAYLGEDLELVG